MFGISYNTWEKACDLYFNEKPYRLKTSLQWHPFLKYSMKEMIISERFFNEYIKNGYCLFSKSATNKAGNFMQKGDGSYRQSQLTSPLIFLIIQCICNEIRQKYTPLRREDISVYYAGNLGWLLFILLRTGLLDVLQ